MNWSVFWGSFLGVLAGTWVSGLFSHEDDDAPLDPAEVCD